MSGSRLVWLPLAACLLVGWAATPLPAQEPAAEEPIDRVAAVVGNVAITFTQLQEEFYTRYSFLQRQPPTDPAQVRLEMRQMLDTLINDELMYQQAIRDTMVKVTQLEIQDAVDAVMRRTRAAVASEEVFQAELRGAGFLGIDDYRRWMTEKQGRELFKNRFIEKLQGEGILAPIEPTEREIRAYYDLHRDEMQMRPPSVSLRQILIRPKPSAAALVDSKRLADSLVAALRDGAEFEVLAKRFSQDPGSAATGGSLGWQRRGVFVREFEQAAFTLPRGAISEPVQSPFGYHIIQVERINPTERLVRHILIAPPVDSTSLAEARRIAEDLRRLVVGGLPFDSLQAIHHDAAEEREARGAVIDSMPPAYQAAIAGVDSGQVSGVFELAVEGQPLLSKFGFVKVTGRVPAGPAPYDQMREVLRRGLGDAMGRDRYLADLRKKTYIDIHEL
jgi:peptidyl-prolyl cis-trans isomerase SurA